MLWRLMRLEEKTAAWVPAKALGRPDSSGNNLSRGRRCRRRPTGWPIL